MSRYSKMFSEIGERTAFGAFLMLGDPDFERSFERLNALLEGGADMIEVGIPFSDPVADGPVIQAASRRALQAGISTDHCFELIARLRKLNDEVPIGILTYANIVIARESFMRDACKAGADSLLVADIPALEAEPFVKAMEQAGIEPVLIAASNTCDFYLEKIAKFSSAYTYCVSRAGITGTHADGEFDPKLVSRLHALGAPPPVFGFGISTPDHVKAASAAGAKGVICGSAIVDLASKGGDVAQFVAHLRSATGNESAPQ